MAKPIDSTSSSLYEHFETCNRVLRSLKPHQDLIEGMSSCNVKDPWNCSKHHPRTLFKTAELFEEIIQDLLVSQSELADRHRNEKTFSDAARVISTLVEGTSKLSIRLHKYLEDSAPSSSEASDRLASIVTPLPSQARTKPPRIESALQLEPPETHSKVVHVHIPPKLESTQHQHCLDLFAKIRLEVEHLPAAAIHFASIKEQAKFLIFNETYQLVSCRAYFHLWLLHRRERPHKKEMEDISYGSKAFLNSQEGFDSTLLERQRAVSRTLLEVALHGLHEAIQANNFEQTDYYLKSLASIRLNQRDGIENQSNIANYLFRQLYEAYKKDCDKPGSTLPKPQTEFGRNGFLGKAGFPVNQSYRLAAFNQVILHLKAAWKIK